MSDLPTNLAPDDEPLDPDFLDDPDPPEPDEPEPDEIDEPEPELPEPDQRRRSRPGEVVRLRERLDRQEQELAELRRRPLAPPIDPGAAAAQAARAAEERRARRELMTPVELAADVERELSQSLGQQILQARVEGFDLADRGRFEQLTRINRAAARLAPEVERLLLQRRQNGDFSLGRTEIFDFLYGREIRERGSAASGQQRRGGQQRLVRQQTRPAGGRGDIARSSGAGRNQDTDDEALLRSITAGDV